MKGKNRNQSSRLIIFFVYIGILFLANYLAFGKFLPFTGNKGLWFFSAFLSALLGSQLITPFYTKPVDALSYSIVSLIAVYLVHDWDKWDPKDNTIYFLSMFYFLLIFMFSIITISTKDRVNKKVKNISNTFRILSDFFGNHRAIFSILIIFLLNVFHDNSAKETLIISIVWVLVVIIGPEEKLLNIWVKIKKIFKGKVPFNFVGSVHAYQNPGLLLIKIEEKIEIEFGTFMAFKDNYSGTNYCMALNYTGRGEALLLRALNIDIIESIKNSSKIEKSLQGINEGLVIKFEYLDEGLKDSISQLPDYDIGNLVGIVSQDTSIERLYFEIIQEKNIEEGRLVEVSIRDKLVIYQIIDGLTKEEIVQQKNTYGYARAKARKIGIWNKDKKKFSPAKWIPNINALVFMKTEEE